MRALSERLVRTYGTPELGNLRDPLEEAVFILLTYQTDLDRARQTFTHLRRRLPLWAQVAKARKGVLEDILRPTGFQNIRARILRLLLRTVLDRFGHYDLSPLRNMRREQAEIELRKLPGLDLKGARCVLLYSLDHATFPVDSNTFRFMQRFGVLHPSSRYRRRSVHDGLEQLVPPSCRRTLHVSLVVHGSATCLPVRPNCSDCVLKAHCPTGKKRHEVS
jgi:endonuclease III